MVKGMQKRDAGVGRQPLRPEEPHCIHLLRFFGQNASSALHHLLSAGTIRGGAKSRGRGLSPAGFWEGIGSEYNRLIFHYCSYARANDFCNRQNRILRYARLVSKGKQLSRVWTEPLPKTE